MLMSDNSVLLIGNTTNKYYDWEKNLILFKNMYLF